MSTSALTALIDGALTQNLGEAEIAMTAHLAARPGVRAVLFYGNRLRSDGSEGLLDFYVLTTTNRAYHGAGISAAANWLLPPNVYFEALEDGTAAKVAVMTLDAFHHRMRQTSKDTTLWARFSQPVVLAHAASDDDRAAVVAALARACQTAGWWAQHLAPDDADPLRVWEALYHHTYGAELRVETSGRAGQIIDRARDRYSALASVVFASEHPNEAARIAAKRAWKRRVWVGKALNLTRLIKAAFTFRGGFAYAISKVERHSGRPVELKGWERRVPWLAAPLILLRLVRDRRLR